MPNATKSQIASLSCCECGEALLFYTCENMTAVENWALPKNLTLRCYLCQHNIIDLSEAIGCKHLPNSQDLYEESSKGSSIEQNQNLIHIRQKWRSALIQFKKRRLKI